MYRDLTVSVVVPCFNEERQIVRVLGTLPPFVDHVAVVDDGSTDRTAEVVRRFQSGDPRIELLQHPENRGVGAAIASGYQWARSHHAGLTVVMAGDAQMDPEVLPALLDPVAGDLADFCKGNRFKDPASVRAIPRSRVFGNAVLSFLTRLISGYGHISDAQNGYTVLNNRVLETLDWTRMYQGYGQPNDLLVRLSLYHFRVAEVSHKAIYGCGEASKIKIGRVILPISWLLLRLAFLKMKGSIVGGISAVFPAKNASQL